MRDSRTLLGVLPPARYPTGARAAHEFSVRARVLLAALCLLPAALSSCGEGTQAAEPGPDPGAAAPWVRGTSLSGRRAELLERITALLEQAVDRPSARAVLPRLARTLNERQPGLAGTTLAWESELAQHVDDPTYTEELARYRSARAGFDAQLERVLGDAALGSLLEPALEPLDTLFRP